MEVKPDTAPPAASPEAYTTSGDITRELGAAMLSAAGANDVGGPPVPPAETAAPAAPTPPIEPPAAKEPAPQSITLTQEQFDRLLAAARGSQQPAPSQAPTPPAEPPAPRSHHEHAARSMLGDGLDDELYQRAASLLEQRAPWEPHASAEGETGQRAKARLKAIDERLSDLRLMAKLFKRSGETQATTQAEAKATAARDRLTKLLTPAELKQRGWPGLAAGLESGALTVDRLLQATDAAVRAGDGAAIDAALEPWEAAFTARGGQQQAATPPAAALAAKAPAAAPAATLANPAVVAPTSHGGHAAPPPDDRYPTMDDYRQAITRMGA